MLYLNGTTISNTTGVMNNVQWWNSLRTFLLAASSLGMTGGDYVFLTAMMNPLGAPDLLKEFRGEGTVGTVLHEAFRSLLVVTADAHGGGTSTENFISEVERRAYGAGKLQAGYQQVMSACACVCVCRREILPGDILLMLGNQSPYVPIAPHFASDNPWLKPCTYSFVLLL